MSGSPDRSDPRGYIVPDDERPDCFKLDKDGVPMRKFKPREQKEALEAGVYEDAEKELRAKHDKLAPYARSRLWSIEKVSRYHITDDEEVLAVARTETGDDTMTPKELEDLLMEEVDVPERLGEVVANKIKEKNITNFDDERVDNYVRRIVLDSPTTLAYIRKLAWERRSAFYFLTSTNYTTEGSEHVKRMLTDIHKGKSLQNVVLDNFKMMNRLGEKVEKEREKEKSKGN